MITDMLSHLFQDQITQSNLEVGPEVQPLERVEIAVANRAAFPQMSVRNGPVAKLLDERLLWVKRRWLVERDVRDDSRNTIHVCELDKAGRIQSKDDLGAYIRHVKDDTYFREVWGRVWPNANTTNNGAGNWWEQWESWPLDLRSAPK